MSTKPGELQYNDLNLLPYHVQNVEHTVHPSIIGKHQRVIQNHSRGMSLFNKHLCKGETHEDGDLFLRSHTQVLERFLVPILPNNTNDMQIFVDGDLSAGKQELQVWTNTLQHRGKIALFCFSLGRTQCR
ncbi:hypothetical protein OCH7691_04577 [Oceanibacterium hippocampi]|uniref:Uncharacterized protein n=1 Tax=Oceanibacterium hippocampi TaxID=745714 RepID=A0A1Y5U051_9PROT|nr:hypothetical protein OCH7691_04577 [Oceanibacterium hippocampi]